MADNVAITPGSGATAAADDINGVLYQRVKLTLGGDGVSDGDASAANPIPVRLDQGNDPINVINGAMQVENLQIESSADLLNSAIAMDGNDEPLQLVGLHPNYPLPIDTSTPMPIAGIGASGGQRQILTDDAGAIKTADMAGPFVITALSHPANSNRYLVVDTSGYQSLSVHVTHCPVNVNGQVWFSNDGETWAAASGYFLAATGTPSVNIYSSYNATSGYTGISMWPIGGRYARIGFANVGAQTGLTRMVAFLRSQPFSLANLQTTTANNLTHIGSAAVAAATAQLGVNAFGPVAAGSAHGANNPVQISGSDGTNVRRILTDTSGNTQVVGTTALAGSLIPSTARLAPVLMGAADLEQRAQRLTVDGLSRLRIQNEESGSKDDGVIDALNNVVRELKLLNAKLTDLPYYLGINSVMPDDDKAFRDDPTIFNA